MIKINQKDIQDVLSNITKWESLGLDPNKGYILCGNPGVGKTYAMREEARTKKIGWGHPALPSSLKDFRDLSTKLIFSRCERNGSSYLLQFTEDHDMWLDDLGFEPIECVSYGTKFNPIQDLVFFRHQMFPKKKTNFTTNYTPVQLEEKYGQAILSRLYEMCNFIVVQGEDLRKV